MKKLVVLLSLLALLDCRKKEEAAPPAEATSPAVATTTTAAPTTPPSTITLPPGALIPSTGVGLWLVADDVKPAAGGKLELWSNASVPNVAAKADKPELQPTIVASAMNGHAVVRFDGVDNMLTTNIDISPAKMPEATVFAVFNSKTDAPELRKLYGDDNGGYDRAVGLDNRGGDKNYVVFTGKGVAGYFSLKANESYVTSDQYTRTDFSGWVNGKAAIVKAEAGWEDALPNLYLGGTGTVYHEPWNGDLAEIIVYARLLSDPERAQVEDYLGKKYGISITR